MTKILDQPPSIWLNEELCKNLYNRYLNNYRNEFALPLFSQRFPGKLEGIIGSVSQSFGGEYLYKSLRTAAAAYFVKISTQHPFIDGNKRISVLYTDAFLALNDVNLDLAWTNMYELSKMVVERKQNGDDPKKLQQFVAVQLSEGSHLNV